MIVCLTCWDKASTDTELVHGALDRDNDAWRELVRRYDGLLHGVALSLGVDRATADDAVQTTWLRLVEHLDALHDAHRIGAWLVSTLRGHIGSTMHGYGREPRRAELDLADLPSDDNRPEDLVVAREGSRR